MITHVSKQGVLTIDNTIYGYVFKFVCIDGTTYKRYCMSADIIKLHSIFEYDSSMFDDMIINEPELTFDDECCSTTFDFRLMRQDSKITITINK